MVSAPKPAPPPSSLAPCVCRPYPSTAITIAWPNGWPNMRPGPAHVVLEAQLPPDWSAQQVYDNHEVLMLHGQRCCFFRNPACSCCPVLDLCPYGQRLLTPPTEQTNKSTADTLHLSSVWFDCLSGSQSLTGACHLENAFKAVLRSTRKGEILNRIEIGNNYG